jgi:hypothetical protein
MPWGAWCPGSTSEPTGDQWGDTERVVDLNDPAIRERNYHPTLFVRGSPVRQTRRPFDHQRSD